MKFRFLNLVLFLSFASFYAQDLLDKIEYGIPKITQFKTKNLGAEDQNLDIIQDEDGVVIVSNSLSFFVFDGIHWSSFSATNEGIPISFAKDNDGKIYTSGTEFIGFLESNNKGGYHFHDLEPKLPKDVKLGFVYKTIYHKGKVYFQNDKSILIFDGNNFVVIDTIGTLNGLFHFENKMYASTSKGLFRIEENNPILITTYFSEKNISIKNAVKTKENQRFFISAKKGLFGFNNVKKENNSNLNNFLKLNTFVTYKKLHDGNFAFATIKGGFLITDTNFNPLLRLTEKDGLTSNQIRNIYQDNHNNLWLACQSGITKINYPFAASFYNFNKQNIGTVEEITRYKDEIYLGTGKGTYKLNSVKKSDLFTENYGTSFVRLSESDIFNFATIVVKDKLIYGGESKTNVFDGNKTKLFNTKKARKFINSKFHKNVLFMGHTIGCDIIFYDEDVAIKKVIKVKKFDQQTRGIAEIDENSLWLATVSDGIYKLSFNNDLENQKIKKFTIKDGLPSMRANLVYNIGDDIVFTTRKGLYKFDESTQKFIPETRFGEKYSGGKSEFIYAFNFDKNQNVWMHSFRKKTPILASINTDGNYTIIEKPLKEIGEIQAYEVLSEPDRNIVWYGGSEGLVRFDVDKASGNSKKYKAIISKIIASKDSLLINGHHFSKEKETTLKPNEKDFRFEVGCTDYTNIKENKFQYKLEGYSNKWSDWTKESFKIYTNLSHGNYTFKVRAKNYRGDISKEDRYVFTILPFWYQTSFFKILALLSLILILSLVISYFSKRKFIKKVYELELEQKFEVEKNKLILEEKEKSLEAIINAQEEERSKIARELHDDVVQQIGSVILRSRNLLIRKKSIEDKEHKEILKSLENSNKDLRNISHQMKPRVLKELGIISALKELFYSLDYVNIKHSFEFFNINNRLPEKIEVTIYRISQEFINNIIKHSKASQVNIQLYTHNNFVIFIVEDDGVGFKKVATRKGIGLLNISSRLNLIKGVINYETSAEKGTIITVKIPL